MRVVEAADLFCGAGGTSTGLKLAARDLGLNVKLTAVNHWPLAIETHTANHADAQHFCATLSAVQPKTAIPSGKLDLLVASPECTHHSRARGGKPMNDQSRASAWQVLDWCDDLRVEHVLIENVPEFEEWGPLGSNGRPLESRKGETFKAWVRALESLNYSVQWRRLVAANYGDATTRERFFLQARRCKRAISWPAESHARNGEGSLFSANMARWKPAREIIDWSIRGKSIFNRKIPLKPNTLARIEAGIRKFWGQWAEPFLVILRNHQNARSIHEPVPTLCTSGAHVGLVQPLVMGQQSGAAARPADQPLPTVATSGAISLIEPFIMPLNHGKNDFRSHNINQPMPTVTTLDAWTVVDPFIVPFFGERDGQSPRVHAIGSPLPTVTGQGAGGIVEPLIVEYYGNGQARPVTEPLQTVTCRDRFGLVTAGVQLDILFRMLQPHELAAAMGFPSDYIFAGSRENRVKQIGNAVPVNLSRALCRHILAA